MFKVQFSQFSQFNLSLVAYDKIGLANLINKA